MTKIYGIYGYREAVIQVPVGDGSAYLMCEFKKGNPQQGPYYRPATYVCMDKVEQEMIEKSSLFGKQIIVYRSFGEDKAAEKPATTVKEKSEKKEEAVELDIVPEANAKSYEGVVDIEGARAALKSLGAKATTLASEAAMKTFMEKKGITFPNFNF